MDSLLMNYTKYAGLRNDQLTTEIDSVTVF